MNPLLQFIYDNSFWFGTLLLFSAWVGVALLFNRLPGGEDWF